MSEHDAIRELLALTAAGALSEEDNQRVARHAASCPACAAEIDDWRRLAGGLRRLPTPQPSALLVERTRMRAEIRLAEEAEQRWHSAVLVFLVIFAWLLTLASWPVVRLATGGLVGWFDPHFQRAWFGFAGVTALVWMTGGGAAILLAMHHRRERRVA